MLSSDMGVALWIALGIAWVHQVLQLAHSRANQLVHAVGRAAHGGFARPERPQGAAR